MFQECLLKHTFLPVKYKIWLSQDLCCMPEVMKNGKAGAFLTIVDACGCYPIAIQKLKCTMHSSSQNDSKSCLKWTPNQSQTSWPRGKPTSIHFNAGTWLCLPAGAPDPTGTTLPWVGDERLPQKMVPQGLCLWGSWVCCHIFDYGCW